VPIKKRATNFRILKRRKGIMKEPKFKIKQDVFIAINPSYVTSEEAILSGYIEGYKKTVLYDENDIEYEYKFGFGMDSTWKKEEEIYLTAKEARIEALKKVNEDIAEIEEKLERYNKLKNQLSQSG
jgi:hypothetical protein